MSYGVLREVQVTDEERAAADAPSSRDRRGAWDLPHQPGDAEGASGALYLLTERNTAIGRGLHNHVVLLDPAVSREHVRLLWQDGRWLIENVSMQNLLTIDGVGVPPGRQREIVPGARLLLGQTTLQLLAPLPEHAPAFTESGQEIERQRFRPRRGRAVVTLLAPRENNTEGRQGLPALVRARWRKLSGTWVGISPGVTMQFAWRQRVSRGRRWAFATGALLLLGGLGVFLGAYFTVLLNVQLSAQAIAQSGIRHALAAISIPVVPALGILLLVNLLDRYEREPWLLRIGAFLWGAVIAIPSAVVIERAIVDGIATIHFGWLSRTAAEVLKSFLLGANAGVTEEVVKGAGLILLLLALRDEFDNVTDGILYGALIGAGFAMVENVVYFATDPGQSLPFLIIGRLVLGWLGHSTFVACLGAGLGYARQTRISWQKWAMPLLGFGAGVLIHTLFDVVDFQANTAVHDAPSSEVVATFALVAIIADYIPPFLAQGILLYLLLRSLSHEVLVIRAYLAEELLQGVVTPDEYLLLQRSFRRTRLERYYLFAYGWRAWLTIRALYQTQIGLAFRKWHVDMGDQPKAGHQQPEEVYRERIKQLRQDLRVLTGSAGPLALWTSEP